jgi:predicted dehydrogenase
MGRKKSKQTRREFLRKTAAVAAPLVITTAALGNRAQAAASERITTALIGSGGRGQQIMGGGDQVLAVCDVDDKHRAKAKATIDAKSGTSACTAHQDYREVLARDDIDAVIVGTPDHWHVPIAMAAVKAGKAVYVEKPVSVEIREGRTLADVAKRYNAVVQVGSQQRSDSKFLRACELVRNGRIGELKTVRVEIPTRAGSDEPWSPQPVPPELDYDLWLGPAPWAPYHRNRCHYQFRFVSDYSGGDVTNWGAHQLDIAQWGIGADDSGPVKITGYGKRNMRGLHDVFYDVNVDFTYENGVVVQLRSGGNGVLFVGTEGAVFVSRSHMRTKPESLATSRIGPDEIHLDPEFGESGLTHMGRWLEAIKTRNRKAINVPPEVGHRSATVCHLANMVMELNRDLTWDPAKEGFVDDDQANRMTWRPRREPWRL